MRILVTGANGLLGGFLVPELSRHGHEVLATGRGPCRLAPNALLPSACYLPLDITDGVEVFDTLRRWKPDHVVHAAAMTQADPCEQDPVACWHVNVTATRFLCSAAEAVGAAMTYLSTDFVFDGESGPYREDDPTGPVNIYGASKLAAERTVLAMKGRRAIVRTVLVYGHSDNIARSSLMTWVRDRLTAGASIQVVGDQVRTPTYAGDLARGVRLQLESGEEGIFHISGADVLTPWEMALRTADLLGLDATLMTRVDASTFSQPARRPLRTGFVIDKARRLLGYEPLSFEEGLARSFGTHSE
ncbi:MAG: SDR family oxidoreductase [Chitinophagia bacterium]|nr:SDR family oxidoreductase [Chitinophagia bacterium]